MKLLFWRKRAKKERTMKIEGKFATEIRWNSIFFFYSSHSTAFIAWERIQITMELLPFFYILRQNACFNIAFVSFMRRVKKKKKKTYESRCCQIVSTCFVQSEVCVCVFAKEEAFSQKWRYWNRSQNIILLLVTET